MSATNEIQAAPRSSVMQDCPVGSYFQCSRGVPYLSVIGSGAWPSGTPYASLTASAWPFPQLGYGRFRGQLWRPPTYVPPTPQPGDFSNLALSDDSTGNWTTSFGSSLGCVAYYNIGYGTSGTANVWRCRIYGRARGTICRYASRFLGVSHGYTDPVAVYSYLGAQSYFWSIAPMAYTFINRGPAIIDIVADHAIPTIDTSLGEPISTFVFAAFWAGKQPSDFPWYVPVTPSVAGPGMSTADSGLSTD